MPQRLGLAALDVDPQSHDYHLTAVVSARTLLAVAAADYGAQATSVEKARFSFSRKWRQWAFGDQIGGSCTGYGTVTLMEAGPITVKKQNLFDDALAFYHEIVAIDRAEGRYYPEGATTLAAMKAAQARGWIGEYRWEFESLEVAHAWLVSTGPFIAGTNWYSSMFTRDFEGVIRISPNATIEGGHLYCINGYDADLDLWRVPNTWGDGYYWIGSPDLERLLGEQGEFVFPRELPQAMWKVAA